MITYFHDFSNKNFRHTSHSDHHVLWDIRTRDRLHQLKFKKKFTVSLIRHWSNSDGDYKRFTSALFMKGILYEHTLFTEAFGKADLLNISYLFN